MQPHLPQPNDPPILYSNQCQQDLRTVLLTAIRKSTSSIYMVMFGLSDRAVINALAQKIDQQIPTTVYFDPSGSPKYLLKILQAANIRPVEDRGLMHQKILILDHETVFLGSANMTPTSLKMHDNLVIGLCNRKVADFLKDHPPYTHGYLHTMVGGQTIEIWLLPDPRGNALTDLRKKIRSAARSIQIAQFTFTHPALVEEVIDAHKRGVRVSIVIDQHSALGASAKAIETLKNANVPVRISKGTQLLHHKFIYIDNQTLLTGSANWTKAAFYKNSDCFIILHHLNDTQKAFMKKIWRRIETNSN